MSTPERIESYIHDGYVFDVVDSGPLDGEVVLLLHGWPERAYIWEDVSAILNAAGYRTLAPDQRGYSPGARPATRYGYRMSRLVADTVALIDRVADQGGGPVHLVGHDWGAAVAWSTAAAHPDRLRTLTAVSVTHPAAFLRSMLRSDQALRSSYMAVFQIPLLPETVFSRLPKVLDTLLARAGMSRDERGRVRTAVVEYGAMRGGLGWYRALPFARPRTLDQPVRVPTTQVWSDRDVALGRTGVELAKDYVAAPFELVVLGGVTHWIPTQAPRALADAILARAGATSGERA